jgi:hypothetical protein
VILKEIEINDKKNKKVKNEDKTKIRIQDDGQEINYEWDESFENPYIKIPLVMIEHNWFILKSIKPETPIIRLDKEKEYGWVRVPEDSTDHMKPYGLNSGDYVLFSKQREAAENDVVIVAGRHDELHEQPSYSIRKLNKDFAHTNAGITGNPDQIQIIGVVVGMGKRFVQIPDSELADDKLYGLFLKKLNGDKKQAAVLFISEQKRNPYARKSQVLKNAILRWELTH